MCILWYRIPLNHSIFLETKETKEKSVPRDSSISDSEENSAIKDLDQQSVGDTDNQVNALYASHYNNYLYYLNHQIYFYSIP